MFIPSFLWELCPFKLKILINDLVSLTLETTHPIFIELYSLMGHHIYLYYHEFLIPSFLRELCPLKLKILIYDLISASPMKRKSDIYESDVICSCACYHENLIPSCLWELCPFEHPHKWPYHCNSSETTHPILMKLHMLMGCDFYETWY